MLVAQAVRLSAVVVTSDTVFARHFAATCMTNIEVYDAFMAWINQDPRLAHLLDWHLLDLQTS